MNQLFISIAVFVVAVTAIYVIAQNLSSKRIQQIPTKQGKFKLGLASIIYYILVLVTAWLVIRLGIMYFNTGKLALIPVSRYVLPLLPDLFLNWFWHPTHWTYLHRAIAWILNIPMVIVVGGLALLVNVSGFRRKPRTSTHDDSGN